MIEVGTDADLLATARTRADAIMANKKIRTTPNYTGLSWPDRYFIGFVGELAMKALLEQRGIRFDYVPRADGRSDARDFVVYHAGTPYDLDVKTRGEARHWRFMVPAAQFSAHRRDIYVGARRMSDSVQLWGWVWRCHAAEFRVEQFQVPTLWCWLDEMRDMEALLENLDGRN